MNNIILPSQARKMTEKGKEEKTEKMLQTIFSDIEKNANRGFSTAGPYSVVTELTDEIIEFVKNLGYEIKQNNGTNVYIVW